jgi:hypothetical protein
LLKANGYIADIFYYPPVEAADRTWCRLPDRNKGSLTFACQPSPGRPNFPFSSTPSTPASTPMTDCTLADTIPQAIASAECGDFGAGIWNTSADTQLWLPERWKWKVFVE